MSGTAPGSRRKPLLVESGGPIPAINPASTAAAAVSTPVVKVGTVRRKFCGTGPFDRHWLNVDCCGLFCACFTYALHAYGVYVVCWIMIPPWMSYTGDDAIRNISVTGMIHRFVFTSIAGLAVISHFKAMTTDPGAVPPDAKPLPEDEKEGDCDNGDQNGEAICEPVSLLTQPPRKGLRLCRRCKAFKPQRAHHCSVCKRCIIKMDHHCPWVNNCVGIGNHKYFLLFVFYTFVSCIYAIILIISRFTTCFGQIEPRSTNAMHGHHVRHAHCLDEATHLLNVLGLLVESLLFGMFTSCMMFDQLDVIQSKVTHIDRFKGLDLVGSLPGVVEVFGAGSRGVDARFRPDWLSPFGKVCFPPSVRDEVMGFCRPNNGTGKKDKEPSSKTTATASSTSTTAMAEETDISAANPQSNARLRKPGGRNAADNV